MQCRLSPWRPTPIPRIARISDPTVSEKEQSDVVRPANRTYIFVWPLNNCVVCNNRLGRWVTEADLKCWQIDDSLWLAQFRGNLENYEKERLAEIKNEITSDTTFVVLSRGVTELKNSKYLKTCTKIFKWMNENLIRQLNQGCLAWGQLRRGVES